MPNPFLEPATVFMYTLETTRPAIKTEGPTPEEAAIVGQHWAHLQALLARGALVFAGRTLNPGDEGFASVVFRADSEADARGVMESDPGVVGGVFRARLYPYQPMLLGSLSAPRSTTA